MRFYFVFPRFEKCAKFWRFTLLTYHEICHVKGKRVGGDRYKRVLTSTPEIARFLKSKITKIYMDLVFNMEKEVEHNLLKQYENNII